MPRLTLSKLVENIENSGGKVDQLVAAAVKAATPEAATPEAAAPAAVKAEEAEAATPEAAAVKAAALIQLVQGKCASGESNEELVSFIKESMGMNDNQSFNKCAEDNLQNICSSDYFADFVDMYNSMAGCMTEADTSAEL